MGSGQQIPLKKLSRRSALSKIQLSTFAAESKAAFANPMTVRNREILSRCGGAVVGTLNYR